MDVLIPIVFPDFKITVFGKKRDNLGHAGILLVLSQTGTTKYFEYGRYDPPRNQGLVRKRLVPDVTVDAAGRIAPAALAPVLGSIAEQSGHGTRIKGAYIAVAGGYPKALAYAEKRQKLNKDPKRKAYSPFTYNCGTFMQQALDAAGVDTPWMLDPRPVSYIDELRDDFPDLDYDPKTKAVVIK